MNTKMSAAGFRPLFHVAQSVTFMVSLRIKAAAIVVDDQCQQFRFPCQTDIGGSRGGMPANVVKCFLEDEEKLAPALRRESCGVGFPADFHGEPHANQQLAGIFPEPHCDVSSIPADGVDQPDDVAHGSSRFVGDASYFEKIRVHGSAVWCGIDTKLAKEADAAETAADFVVQIPRDGSPQEGSLPPLADSHQPESSHRSNRHHTRGQGCQFSETLIGKVAQ
jgi:hypothetical protein